MDRSIRIFGQYPFKESVPFHQPLSPRELAVGLIKYIEARNPEDRARYPDRPVEIGLVKGWTISRCTDLTDENGNPLVAAYAAWIKP
jgi:hypothetical protein